jgi:hypothetical protein
MAVAYATSVGYSAQVAFLQACKGAEAWAHYAGRYIKSPGPAARSCR